MISKLIIILVVYLLYLLFIKKQTKLFNIPIYIYLIAIVVILKTGIIKIEGLENTNTPTTAIVKGRADPGDDPLLPRLLEKANGIFNMTQMPYVQNFVNFEPYRQTSSTLLKGLFNNDPTKGIEKINNNVYDEDPFNDMMIAIFQYSHPESPRYKNQTLRKNILIFFPYHIYNMKTLIFPMILYYSISVLFMVQTNSDLLVDLKDAIDALYKETQRQINRIIQISDPHTENFICTNIHYRIVTGLYILGLVKNDLQLVNKARAYFSVWKDLTLPHGGMLYTGNANEIYTYHQLNLQCLLYLHAVTPNEKFFKEVIELSKLYVPIQSHPAENAVEYITVGIWKKMWAPAAGLANIAQWVKFVVLRDKWNGYFSRNMIGKNVSNPLYLSLLTDELLNYHKIVTKNVSLPMNQIGEDLNVLGFRIRNPTSEIVCTTREPSFPTMKKRPIWDGCGLRTLIGFMCVGVNNASKVHSVLEGVSFGVKLFRDEVGNPDFDTLLLTEYRIGIYKMKGGYNVLNPYGGSLAIVHQNTSKNSPESDFPWLDMSVEGTQVYVASRGKLTGYIKMTATKDFSCKDVRFFLTFISGRGGWGSKRDIKTNSDGTFSYGNMNYKVNSSLTNNRDFIGTIFGQTGLDDKSVAQSYGLIDSNYSGTIKIKKGDTWTLQISVCENTQSFNEIKSITEKDGLLTMVTDDSTVVFNTTESLKRYTGRNGYYTSSLTKTTTQNIPQTINPYEHYTILNESTKWTSMAEYFQ